MITEIEIDRLTLLDKNPRKISKENLEKLKQSIKEDSQFLYLRPILVNKKNNNYIVYAGNQRVLACKELGYAKVPCIVEEDLPDSVIDFRVIQDNYHAGVWDIELLNRNFARDLVDKLDLKEFKFMDSIFNSEEIYMNLYLDVNCYKFISKFLKSKSKIVNESYNGFEGDFIVQTLL